MKPLEGVRILTLEQFGAGPYGSMFLADMGAEVIKVENPAGGDASRGVGPHFLGPDDSQYFQTWSGGKKSVALDLKTEAGRADFRALAATAHAAMNNLRGDQPAALGLDYASLSAVNPAIVCLHISAYGRDNERAAWPGYDFLMQAEAGLMSLTGEPDGPPSRVGASMIDYMTGVTGVVGLLGALWRARETGKGCDVDASLFDVALHQLGYSGTWFLNGAEMPTRLPRGAHSSLTPVQTQRTRDGWIYVMCMKDKFWGELTARLGRSDLARDSRFSTMAARLANREALTAALDEAMQSRTTAEWLAAFAGAVPAAPVNDVRQAFANPFVGAVGMVAAAPHPAKRDFRRLANPLRFDGKRPVAAVAPKLGADTDAVLGPLRSESR